MLTRLRVRNFKRFDDIDIDLDSSVVLIGPNNSGKTTALQALALWEIGLRRWSEKRGGSPSPEKRSGVAVNRRDLIAIPVPGANLLWRDKRVRIGERDNSGGERPQRTTNIRVEIIVDGVSDKAKWSCGLEFDYANEESFYCRPLRQDDGETRRRMDVPEDALSVRTAYLPPMSGLAAVEPKYEPGRINVLIGEGQTAQVLRNLCHQISVSKQDEWKTLARQIRELFGVDLHEPKHIGERGEVTMRYTEQNHELDLSCAGRGLQQTLLLLAHLYANPRAVLLLDEPDAHLEILRQRQTYQLLRDVACAQGSQVIAASHSEVVLNEAAGRDVVIAFVGRPHRIDKRPSQVLKALRDIGFDQYYQAEQTGWVLYMESPSDLEALRAFARSLSHHARHLLDRPFVHYVANNLPQLARDHFFGLHEAKPDLVGIAIFDRLEKKPEDETPLRVLTWRRREIENYFCSEAVLLAWVRADQPDPLFIGAREAAMRAAITEVTAALATLGKPDPQSPDIKASDDFLAPVFEKYYKSLHLPLGLRKREFAQLAALVPLAEIDAEINEKLDAIVEVASGAKPASLAPH